MYIIYALLGFSLLIIVHELGHFVMAKVNGIKVEEFAIGMGPKILSTQGKETKYSIGLFPIGGYVKMMGEEEEVQDERSFSSKSPLRRISVIIAGATMNFLFAIIIFTVFLNKFGYSLPKVNSLIENMPAVEAGLQEGDKFLKVNGSRVFSADDLTIGISLAKDNPINFLVERNGEKKEVTVTPKLTEENGRERYMIGFGFERIDNPGIVQSFKQSFKETLSVISQTYKSLKMMIMGEVNFKTDVGGPVSIIRMSSEAAKNGIWNLMYFIAFISINLAVFNMLPFPALDGGWTVILLIELITRRKVPDKVVGAMNYVGIMLLFGLMIIVTIKDILFPIQI
ncbi:MULTISPECIES: M50 family metallopeptidase [Clostridium]|uniref:M50 family metallopeptidase n=3 Tax=Clostridium tertium TaxID=1559 RepID=A0A9X4B126_9CLOT|nr:MULTISPECIES: M50 family metallopeptidase [Clostridium]MBP1867009.1 regulator of sigma E protease [Clostridium tertium]MBS5883458.1 site-2 protease family protein [Clostridium sp.]MBS6501162.1 site-2 protease family protein [Clostridium sp.]MBU6135685.1 M50 family metallopeptidase [Clostridium tertium]MDB1939919.1 M50 family metallopeptidase [Clostridium tertium]